MVEAKDKPKKKVSAKGRNGTANLIPVSLRSKEEAKELGRKGGIKSGEVRREKKLLREHLTDILSGKVKDIPLAKDKLKELCAKWGIKIEDYASRQIAGRVVYDALDGNYKAIEQSFKADGSELPTQIEFGGSGFSINIVNGKDTQETQSIWENEIDDLEE